MNNLNSYLKLDVFNISENFEFTTNLRILAKIKLLRTFPNLQYMKIRSKDNVELLKSVSIVFRCVEAKPLCVFSGEHLQVEDCFYL